MRSEEGAWAWGAVLIALLSTATEVYAQGCEPRVATIVSAQGAVEIERLGQPRWQAVAQDDPICPGDRVRVGPLGRAAVRLADEAETQVRLDERTLLTFPAPQAEKSFLLKLIEGVLHVLSRVPHTLTIETPLITAGVEGTEFVLGVSKTAAELWVFEGRVRYWNAQGQLQVASGEGALARPGQAPVRRVRVKPREAVEWALYYPLLVDLRPESYPPALRGAVSAYRDNDLPTAFTLLERVPAAERDGPYHLLRAGLLLGVGRVSQAEAELTEAEQAAPKAGGAPALRSVIALVRDRKDKALQLAEKGAGLEPDSPLPQAALSYAHQGRFDTEKALAHAQRAVELMPEDALLRARVSELELSRGDLDAALEAAEKAEALSPALPRTQTVLGYAYLTRIEVDRAKAAFERALRGDPADPLPRLGLGLAKIRDGDLEAGRRDIETAASLDPDNSLVRSYLGKAYYEEKRDGLAAGEYERAKLLDPKDPTPWFYDAIRKQTTNQPVEALHDLQRAIELNDNRAVYRSKLLLDQDLAARGAALGRIYRDLGFEQAALAEGWTSLGKDPTDFSAHRLLADTYSVLPRHELARVSELFQSQLLQSTNITPVQPQLAESDLFLLGGLGPAEPSLNEFNSLFLRNRLSFLGSGLVGSHETYGDEVVQSGIWNNLSYSIGQFHYESGGFRPNNDLDTNIYTAFAQYALSSRANFQIELRRREIEAGDLRNFANPAFEFENLSQHSDGDSARFGLRLAVDPKSDVVGSFAYTEIERDIDNPSFTPLSSILTELSSDILDLLPRGLNTTDHTSREVDDKTIELQYIRRWNRINTIIGVGYTSQEQTSGTLTGVNLTSSLSPNLQQELEDEGLTPGAATQLINSVDELQGLDLDMESSEESYFNGYFYSTIKPWESLRFSIGAAVNSLSRDSDQSDRLDVTRVYISPKVGAIWEPFPSMRIRAAWFQSVTTPFASDQTIEPTQIAGFNQLFDDGEGTRFQRYGLGVDYRWPLNLLSGFEFTWRDLEVPRFFTSSGGPPREKRKIVQNEASHRAYLSWTPTRRTALGVEYFYEQFDREFESANSKDRLDRFGLFDPGAPLSMEQHRVPLSFNYYHENGWFVSITATYVNQNVTLRGETNDLTDTQILDASSDRFWQTDLSIGYRLPKRYGILRFGVLNLFDEDIQFNDANEDVIGDIENEPLQPLFVPERVLFGQVTLAF